MRVQFWLLGALSQLLGANALGLGQPFEAPLPRITEASTHDAVDGWTPKPAEEPEVELARKGHPEFLRAMKRQGGLFLNAQTCGWFSGWVSEPFTCSMSSTCVTGIENVVGCSAPGGQNPFFTVCLDYAAYTRGLCDSAGPLTGCCMTSTYPQCVTYTWLGASKSMFICGKERTVLTLLNTPWDRSTSTSSTTRTRTTSSTILDIPTSTSTTTIHITPTSTSSGNNNGSNTPVGAIVGGVVGGIVALGLVIGVITWIVLHRPKNKPTSPDTTYTTVPQTDAHMSMAQSPAAANNGAFVAPAGYAPVPPASPSPNVDPNKMTPSPYQQQQPFPPPQAELASNELQLGQHGFPAEMMGSTPEQLQQQQQYQPYPPAHQEQQPGQPYQAYPQQEHQQLGQQYQPYPPQQEQQQQHQQQYQPYSPQGQDQFQQQQYQQYPVPQQPQDQQQPQYQMYPPHHQPQQAPQQQYQQYYPPPQ